MGNQPLPNPDLPANVKRFRSNPVEVAIFSVITLIFFNSVYHLFYEQGGFKPAALSPMAANPVSETAASGRSPASVAPPAFANIPVRCGAEAAPEQDLTATKVRLTGPLCGDAPSKLVKLKVVNTANKFNATVFADVNAAQFSTDYIPLNSGRNPIHIEFTYPGGQTVAQDLNLVKN